MSFAPSQDAVKLMLSDGREVSYDEALQDERNLLYRLKHRDEAQKFEDEIWSHRTVIQAIVAQHLRIPETDCTIEEKTTWSRGKFNICVYVQIARGNGMQERKVFRCPMPHKLGSPELDDEKIRSEVANYAWIERHCPEIPVAHLIGFGFSTSYQYTSTQHLAWYQRLFYHGARLLRAICGQTIYPYVRHRTQNNFGPYLLMDFIEPSRGLMLSQRWTTHPGEERTRNLYRGLCHIMLSLARIPQSRIGSLRFNDDRTVTLSQRPLLCSNILLESEGVPKALHSTYPSSGSFFSDLIRFRQNIFRSQPNAVNDEQDCNLQMSHLVTLRSLLPMDISGPFVLQHTDLHQSNIFVDENWKITGLIDLEFLSALPSDMLYVPEWLSAKSIDTVDCDEYAKTCENFLDILDTEATRIVPCWPVRASIQRAWKSGAFWMYHCLTSTNALSAIMELYIHPMYGFSIGLSQEDCFAQLSSKFWSLDSELVRHTKVAERAKYASEMSTLFQTAAADFTN